MSTALQPDASIANKRKLTIEQLAEARTLYEAHGQSEREISERFAVSRNTIRKAKKRAEEAGMPWVKNSRKEELIHRVAQKTLEATTEDLAIEAARMNDTHAKAWRVVVGTCIKKLKLLAEQDDPNARALKDVTTALARAQIGERLAMGFGTLSPGSAPAQADIDVPAAVLIEVVDDGKIHVGEGDIIEAEPA